MHCQLEQVVLQSWPGTLLGPPVARHPEGLLVAIALKCQAHVCNAPAKPRLQPDCPGLLLTLQVELSRRPRLKWFPAHGHGQRHAGEVLSAACLSSAIRLPCSKLKGPASCSQTAQRPVSQRDTMSSSVQYGRQHSQRSDLPQQRPCTLAAALPAFSAVGWRLAAKATSCWRASATDLLVLKGAGVIDEG